MLVSVAGVTVEVEVDTMRVVCSDTSVPPCMTMPTDVSITVCVDV